MAGPAIPRMEEQIRAKIAMMLLRDLADPRIGLVTITRVRLSRDFERCSVFWSTLDEGPKRRRTEQALNSARGYVQREIAGMLRTRRAPHLEFEFDPSVEGAARVSDLIDRATREDSERRKTQPEESPTAESDLEAPTAESDPEAPPPPSPAS